MAAYFWLSEIAFRMRLVAEADEGRRLEYPTPLETTTFTSLFVFEDVACCGLLLAAFDAVVPFPVLPAGEEWP